GAQDLERAPLRGARQGVGILPHEERPVDALAAAVVADGLRGRQDVGLVEAATERAAPMTARAEADELVGVGQVRLALVVRALDLWDIDQKLGRRWLPCERMDAHVLVGLSFFCWSTPARLSGPGA